jgi:hypothetical protein
MSKSHLTEDKKSIPSVLSKLDSVPSEKKEIVNDKINPFQLYSEAEKKSIKEQLPIYEKILAATLLDNALQKEQQELIKIKQQIFVKLIHLYNKGNSKEGISKDVHKAYGYYKKLNGSNIKVDFYKTHKLHDFHEANKNREIVTRVILAADSARKAGTFSEVDYQRDLDAAFKMNNHFGQTRAGDENMKTPLMYAAELGDDYAIDFIYKKAKLHEIIDGSRSAYDSLARDRSGQSAADYAISYKAMDQEKADKLFNKLQIMKNHAFMYLSSDYDQYAVHKTAKKVFWDLIAVAVKKDNVNFLNHVLPMVNHSSLIKFLLDNNKINMIEEIFKLPSLKLSYDTHVALVERSIDEIILNKPSPAFLQNSMKAEYSWEGKVSDEFYSQFKKKIMQGLNAGTIDIYKALNIIDGIIYFAPNIRQKDEVAKKVYEEIKQEINKRVTNDLAKKIAEKSPYDYDLLTKVRGRAHEINLEAIFKALMDSFNTANDEEKLNVVSKFQALQTSYPPGVNQRQLIDLISQHMVAVFCHPDPRYVNGIAFNWEILIRGIVKELISGKMSENNAKEFLLNEHKMTSSVKKIEYLDKAINQLSADGETKVIKFFVNNKLWPLNKDAKEPSSALVSAIHYGHFETVVLFLKNNLQYKGVDTTALALADPSSESKAQFDEKRFPGKKNEKELERTLNLIRAYDAIILDKKDSVVQAALKKLDAVDLLTLINLFTDEKTQDYIKELSKKNAAENRPQPSAPSIEIDSLRNSPPPEPHGALPSSEVPDVKSSSMYGLFVTKPQVLDFDGEINAWKTALLSTLDPSIRSSPPVFEVLTATAKKNLDEIKGRAKNNEGVVNRIDSILKEFSIRSKNAGELLDTKANKK